MKNTARSPRATRGKARDVQRDSIDGAPFVHESGRLGRTLEDLLEGQSRPGHDQLVAEVVPLVTGADVCDRRDHDALGAASALRNRHGLLARYGLLIGCDQALIRRRER
jgi:hypothetical protein